MTLPEVSAELVGDDGVAFGRDADGRVVAQSISDGSILWTSSLSGTATSAGMDGHVAFTEDSTGDLVILNGVGAEESRSPLALQDPDQGRLGVYVAMDGGTVTGKFATPLNEADFSYQGGRGARTNSGAPRRAPRYDDIDTAALKMLADLYPVSIWVRAEFGARLCKDSNNKFLWGPFRLGEETSFEPRFNTEECIERSHTVGFVHTPPYADIPTLPSGFASEAEYSDPGGSDLFVADQHPSLVFYLAASNHPFTAVAFYRYQAIAPSILSKDNVWKYVIIWARVPPAW